MRVILLLVTILFSFGYHLLTGWYPDVRWIQDDFMSMVWPALAAFLATVAIIFVSLHKKCDPVQGAWGALAFVGCMLMLPLIIAREQQARIDISEQQSLKESRKELRLERLRLANVKAEEIKEQMADRRERAKTDRFAQYEGSIPMDVLNSMRELDAAMLDDVRSHAEQYKKVLDANPTLGPDAWVRFRRIDQLSLEIAKHKELYETTRAFSQFVESFEEHYQKRIEELNLQPPADRIAIAELERILQDWERSNLYELRRLDVKLLGSAIKALNILSEEWGSWSYDPRNQTILFENRDQDAAFSEAILLIKAILEEVRMINNENEPED